MTRRVLALMGRDIKASLREFTLVYGLVAPFLVALVMRAFIPGVGGTSLNLVVTQEVGPEMIGRLDDYARVEVVSSREALERRVLALDDVAGIVPDGDTYRVILQGNEAHDTAVLPGLVLADILGPGSLEVAREDLGRVASPLKPVLAILLALTAMMIGGMMIGFSIIEDKETGVLSAVAVSPMSRFEYVAGRSILGFVLSVVLVYGSLYTMGAGPFDFWQVLVVTLPGTFLAVIFGFYIGAISENQISGIASVKFGSLPFLVGPILTAVLPERWHFTLWWLPTYWTYLGYREVFTPAGALWSEVLRLSAVSLGVSLLFLAASWRLFSRRLVLRG
ncbi:MAG TPA: hypothetical protein DHW14_07125 [Clostridiales bacterium]|nr:hypothetical protein [Clostridiales bacterium]